MRKKKNDPADSITDKKVFNAGKGAVKQGGEEDAANNDGNKLNDQENMTGHKAALGKEKENPKDGNIGKNNAGGYK